MKNEMNHLRKEILDLAIEQNNGHLAPALSIVEILYAIYNGILQDNDKFILSKGHGYMALYVILKHKGLNPKIGGHPDMDVDNGIECTTGSLGHGLTVGLGMALAKKIMKEDGSIYVLISDGECQEGTTWESLMIASHHNLDNLTVIVDYNKLQALDLVENILSIENLNDKFKAFGGHVIEVDGHNMDELNDALHQETNQPKVIIAHTVKGKGIKIAENNPIWHNKLPWGKLLEKIYTDLE